MSIRQLLLLNLYLLSFATAALAQKYLPKLPKSDSYRIVFQDEFEGSSLDWSVWESEDAVKNSPSGQKTYRSKSNAIVEDGLLKLVVREESVRGSEWTAAYVWLKRTYGANTYYESRFSNTAATGINNAFWMACRTSDSKPYKNRYEIDCPENKVHLDGTVHAHLAWHDWKTSSYLERKHIAQGFLKIIPNPDMQTWGLWVGEKEFAIYYEGKKVWDGVSHPKYRDQYCSGKGKFPNWNPQEEKRAYGRYGQDDWCYFGGMNGDDMNVCFATMPWQSKGTPLTKEAEGAFMGVDYLRIYKLKSDFNTKLVKQADRILPEKQIKLSSPIDLSKDKTHYVSFLIKRDVPCEVALSLEASGETASSIRFTSENSLEISRMGSTASSANSYPASDRLGSSVPVGSTSLVVIRMTCQSNAKSIISCKVFDRSSSIDEKEPFLYHNIDDIGNSSITTEWDLSKKIDSSDLITAIKFSFDSSVASCGKFKYASNYLAVVHDYLSSRDTHRE